MALMLARIVLRSGEIRQLLAVGKRSCPVIWLAARWRPAGGPGRLRGGEPEVLGVEHGFVEQRCDVVVVEGVDDLAAGALADDQPELSQHP